MRYDGSGEKPVSHRKPTSSNGSAPRMLSRDAESPALLSRYRNSWKPSDVESSSLRRSGCRTSSADRRIHPSPTLADRTASPTTSRTPTPTDLIASSPNLRSRPASMSHNVLAVSEPAPTQSSRNHDRIQGIRNARPTSVTRGRLRGGRASGRSRKPARYQSCLSTLL